MNLKVKDMDVATGGALVIILNENDAKLLDIHALDRVKVKTKKKKRIETCVVDIAESCRAVPPGSVGIYEEVLCRLNIKHNDLVEIIPAKKPLSLDYIKKKLDGKKLTKTEIDQIVWDIVHNKLSDIELTYFISACYTRLMDLDETIFLTKAMAHHGNILKLNRYPIIDKHCTGGIAGNRTTMVIVPIVAAVGLTIPKTSSRSITSPAGTADTMEVLANVSFSINKMKKIVEKTNGCIIWGGSLNLAPADDQIIRVEKPLRIDAESQLLASIMAKKISVSSTHILVDIPVGSGSKVKYKKEALKLKKDFEMIGKKLNKKVKVILTNGNCPIGNGIGPALEARDVLWILKNDPRAPADLKEKSIYMAGLILEMVGEAKNGKKKASEILESGLAYKKMKQIIKAQNGKLFDPSKIKLGNFTFDVKADKTGKINFISNNDISKIARIAGAPVNKGAGIYFHKHLGDMVKKKEKIFTVYAESKRKIDYAKEIAKQMKIFNIS